MAGGVPQTLMEIIESGIQAVAKLKIECNRCKKGIQWKWWILIKLSSKIDDSERRPTFSKVYIAQTLTMDV